jgi:hypothetical protein
VAEHLGGALAVLFGIFGSLANVHLSPCPSRMYTCSVLGVMDKS